MFFAVAYSGAMELSKALEQLHALDTGDQTAPSELRRALRQLVYGDLPSDPAALGGEIFKLRREVALLTLDKEFAAEREQCLMRHHGSSWEPTTRQLLTAILLYSGIIFFIGKKAWSVRTNGDLRWPLWYVFAFLGLFLLLSFCRSVSDLYRRMNRLKRAKAAWERNRRLLEELDVEIE